jgi:Lon-like ATP-dependent protease
MIRLLSGIQGCELLKHTKYRDSIKYSLSYFLECIRESSRPFTVLTANKDLFLTRSEKKVKKGTKLFKEDDDSKDPLEIDDSTSDNSSSSMIDAIIPDNHSRELTKPSVPDYFPELICLPISGRPLFARFLKPVQVKDQEVYRAIINLKKRGQPYLGAFLSREEHNEKDKIVDLDEIHRVGVLSQIQQVIPSENTATILLLPHRRIRATKIIKTDPVTIVKVENLKDEPYNKENPVIKAISQELIATLKDIAKLSPIMREQINMMSFLSQMTTVFEDPSQLADFCAGLVGGNPLELQDILECLFVEDRLRKTLELLKKELVNVRLQYEIGKEVEEKINKRQREYYLMEQLKNIKKELGMEKDDKETLIGKFKEKAQSLQMTEQAKKVFDEEIGKLSHLETASAEFNVTRNYLDWITQIPWGIFTKENFDIHKAEVILDEDHYGLKDVKERILEFIAVGSLRGTVQGKILCLVGPPGKF